MAKATFSEECGLTELEAAYLTKLRSGAIISVETFAGLHDGPLANPPMRVRKVIAQLRRKIDDQNVEITTHYSRRKDKPGGWQLTQAARQRLTFLLNQPN